jgi:hypothetical protein
MTTKLAEVRSLEYSGEIKANVDVGALLGNLTGGKGPMRTEQPTTPDGIKFSIEVNAKVNGLVDVNDINKPQGAFSLNLNTNALAFLAGDQFTPEAQNSSFKLEVRHVGKIGYVKLSVASDFKLFDSSTINNQWIKIDTEAAGLEKLKEWRKEDQMQQAWWPLGMDILEVTQVLASEKVNGVDTHHYKFAIDKQKVPIEEKAIADFANAIPLSEGEVWIGKRDFLPHKLTLTVPAADIATVRVPVRLALTFMFENFDKPVHIEIPAQAKPFGGTESLL